ncbi:LexA repressor [Frankliniella fusca]|uniref:LexA repressor n=1 Tax=Frankliniella fusca TaxID=407009 RepID=A0AAE1HAV3_9NEOP|nr:LexA repressor [Frankliniella fusca]
MSGSGLEELWVESGVAAETMASKVMEGKVYSKGMRLMKLTLQALWRIILPVFQQHLLEVDPDLADKLTRSVCDIICLEEVLQENNIYLKINEWVKSTENVELQFWMTYVEMAHILLEFTRSMRDGKWDLYLSSLSQMLPYLARYDHHNYLKSLSVYIAEMHALPSEVEAAFRQGDFVVKASPGSFNQVDPDHAQEWLVGEVKKASSGVIGLVQDESSLQRWALTYCWHAAISRKTYQMFDLEKATDLHAELYPGRKKRDQSDEDYLVQAMKAFGMFKFEPDSTLKNVATKDVATDDIKTSLPTVKEQGTLQVSQFINNRLSREKSESFYARVKLNAAPTFHNLYKNDQSKQMAVKKTNKQDRNILQRLITAYEAGRAVDLKEILKHELHNFPLSLVHANGTMRTGNKAELMKVLTENVEVPNTLAAGGNDHLIIDGQALIMSIGKPHNAQTFGDLANAVTNRIKSLSSNYQRVDVVFDRYNKHSIKAETRQKRTATSRPIRRAITSRAVPLPKSWSNYITLEENKSELADFISNEILTANYGQTTVVVAGGFTDELQVNASNGMDCSSLQSTHEESDTRVILHAVNSPHSRVVVSARDTDVFVLLLHHFKSMKCKECFMMAGTAKDRKYVPIHTVCAQMSVNERKNILAFHALTGCDTNSFIAGIGKRGALAVYRDHCKLLDGLGVGEARERLVSKSEKFMVLLYKRKENTCDEARHILFGKVSSPELLPPTSDAARLHILRATYQAAVWLKADTARPDLPDPCQHGWRLEENYTPVYTTLPAVPETCTQLLSCGCRSACSTRLCKCRREEEVCTKLCKCQADCSNVHDDVFQ